MDDDKSEVTSFLVGIGMAVVTFCYFSRAAATKDGNLLLRLVRNAVPALEIGCLIGGTDPVTDWLSEKTVTYVIGDGRPPLYEVFRT